MGGVGQDRWFWFTFVATNTLTTSRRTRRTTCLWLDSVVVIPDRWVHMHAWEVSQLVRCYELIIVNHDKWRIPMPPWITKPLDLSELEGLRVTQPSVCDSHSRSLRTFSTNHTFIQRVKLIGDTHCPRQLTSCSHCPRQSESQPIRTCGFRRNDTAQRSSKILLERENMLVNVQLLFDFECLSVGRKLLKHTRLGGKDGIWGKTTSYGAKRIWIFRGRELSGDGDWVGWGCQETSKKNSRRFLKITGWS